MDKLEKHIKHKLEQRTIAPSSGAWGKIAKEINTSTQKRNNWYPYAIAASFIGVVLISTLLFNPDQPDLKQNIVVETENENTIQTQAEESATEDLLKTRETQVVENQPEVISSRTTESSFLEEAPSQNEIAEQILAREPLQDAFISKSDDVITLKVEEVVAQVQQMERLQGDVSDAYVDSLLMAAQKEILADKLIAQSGSVDAMSLLAEVEDELDESFRDQIFDALKAGYFKLRTAVADRNQ